ncbi:UNVERIFIED_CONTAM: hypothetical protein K2H54_049635 [Gekko kuhli]
MLRDRVRSEAMLMNNITVNEKLIQNFQEHLKELQKEYGKLQLDVYRFQKNQTNLQKKFTYDMSQCIRQMNELKEQCEERIEEITRKGNEIPQSKEKTMSDKHYQYILLTYTGCYPVHTCVDTIPTEPHGAIKLVVPTFGQPEFQQHDLTKQGNEPEEKQKISENSAALEASKPTPFIRNVAELDYHKDKGNDDVVAINKEEPSKEEEKHPADKDHPPVLAKSSRDNKELHPEPGTEQNPYEDIRNTVGEVVVEGQNGRWPGPIGHQDTNQANTDDEEVEREQLFNDDLQQDDQEISKNVMWAENILCHIRTSEAQALISAGLTCPRAEGLLQAKGVLPALGQRACSKQKERGDEEYRWHGNIAEAILPSAGWHRRSPSRTRNETLDSNLAGYGVVNRARASSQSL